MNFNRNSLPGIIALIMGSFFALLTALISIINFYSDSKFNLGVEIIVPYLFITIVLFMRYVIGRLEEIHRLQTQILSQPTQGVEIFRTSDEFLNRLTEVTVGADEVCTLNLSPPKGTQPALDKYFEKVHKFIKAKNNNLSSFRSIALIDSKSKAEWVLKRSILLSPIGKVSVALFNKKVDLLTPLGFHIVIKEKELYTFFYPPVSTTGIMESYLVKNSAIGKTMIKYFDIMWSQAIGLHYGREIKEEGLNFISDYNEEVLQNEDFLKLKQMIIK